MKTKIEPDQVIFSLDIGTRSVIGTAGVLDGKDFMVIEESYVEHEERAMIDGQIHDISLVANAVNKVKTELESKLEIKLQRVAIAAAGRFLRTTTSSAELVVDNTKEIDREAIRSLELTAVKNAEDSINKDTQGKLYCVGYSVKNYYLNGYIISNLLSHKGDTAGVELIATFLPRSVVDSLYSVMNRVGLEVESLTLEPIAAMEAVIPKSLRLLNIALIDIGAGTSDIAISSNESITAYGMVSTAGDEVTEAIAQHYLVDFNTAERMKREISSNESISYVDVLGIENQVSSEEILKVISPTVSKACDEIGDKIVELNGGKAPNAIFLVGGGAHTPMLKEVLAEKLNLPAQRIAIKGRDAVADCKGQNNELGSTGVTVLGIALVCIKRMGQDFIDVTFNGSVVSLFNYRKHTVMDVLVQVGVNPKILIGKNGKNIKFDLNGVKRVVFGTLAKNAIIKVNGAEASIDSSVKEGDIIDITYATDGVDAKTKVIEYAANYDTKSFYLNGQLCNIEPVALINGEKVSFDTDICNMDKVQIFTPATLGEYIKYCIGKMDLETNFYINNVKLDYDYIIKDGDNIIKTSVTPEKKSVEIEMNEIKNIETGSITLEESSNKSIEKTDEVIHKLDEKSDAGNKIRVKVNSTDIILKGKDKYVFVDIFDEYDFDRSIVKGILVTKLNGNKAGFFDQLKDGDFVEIYWG
ncbi:cell division protein FtsA [Clostridium oryzae]|uniref:Cell division protein FtsA n=1 Tax=Clostridium oryzae TaxID=1450648 RepID=A0A1V4ICT0_9CLOT|nr:cell division protein FtsA [Clostridium oryzae]OPJ57664.1 cell division protein FtsA [Clostridium oryzae]